jgi:PAS domain S-box-containing protein
MKPTTSLIDSELRYRRLFETAQNGILILDAKTGMVVDVNPFLTKMLGYSHAAFLGKKIWELGFFKDIVGNEANFAELQAKEYIRYEDKPLETSDGRRIEVEFVSNVYLVNDQKVIQCNIRDISARKRAEEALQNSQLMIRDIINALPASVFWKDKNLRYLGCNNAFARDAGFAEPKDIIGKNDHDLVWREQAEGYRSDDRQVIQSGCAKLLIEESLTTSAGKTIALLTSKLPLRDSKGEIIGLLGIYMDVTERKRAEAVLRESEQAYRSLFEHTNEGIAHCQMIFENGKAKDFVYLEVNPSFGALTGLKDVVGKPASEVVPGICEKDAELIEAYGRVAATGKSERFERFVEALQQWFDLSVFSPKRGFFVAVFDVITERKRAEAALRESQAILMESQRIAGLGSYVTDLIAGRWSSSEVLDEVFGIGPTYDRSVAGWVTLIHPDDRAMMVDYLEKEVLGRRQPFKKEYRIVRHNDQSERWVKGLGRLEFDAQGRPVKMIGTIQDVTERKEAEKALRASEARYRQLHETMRDAFGIVDMDGRIQESNHAFQEMMGYSDAELKQLSYMDLTPAKWHALDAQIIRDQVLPRGYSEVYEKEYRRKDGSVFPINLRVTMIRNDAGQATGMWAVIRDITERKLIEKSLTRLSTAVEQAAETIVITDTSGTILYANPAFEKSTGYTRAEAVGQNPRVLKSGKQDAEFYRRMWETLQRGEVWEGHFINKRKDGSLYEEEATISPIRDAAGKVTSFVAVKRDVTREMQLEAQVRQTQKLEAIGTLAGGVAHDFNNILGVIQLQVGLLKEAGRLPSEAKGYADEIISTVKRAADLTRQLLLFSRKEEMQPRDLDLNQGVTDLGKMLRRVLNERIGLQLKLAAQPMFIHADPGMMDQVLMNLAANARDAMPEGGQLVIETEGVEFDKAAAAQSALARPGSFVRLSVSDSGDGIPPELLPRIFEPFFTTKQVGKGTGLGLATVYGIVQRHKGWINVCSEVGRGTTFKIYLPRLAGVTPQKKAAEMLGTAPTGRETILLVEDEPVMLNSIKKSLANLGYHVLEASNGVKALEVWREHRRKIKLLLTDMVMPENLTGRELAEILIKENPKLKVIYMSGYSADVVKKDFPFKAGVNFLAKPFQIQALAKIIRENLDKPD